ncbi:MAG: phosphoribosylglycinamide formyltransferase [Gammaproteobacteria bacterium]
MKLSFLASHGGSSARKIIEAVSEGILSAYEIGILITNNSSSAIYQWCNERGIDVFHISARTNPNEEDEAIAERLAAAETDMVVLSGYMKKIGPMTLKRFDGKILNIHPSLLPRHGGPGLYGDFVHAAVLAAGDTESGATVHWVNEHYDEGPIVLQRRVPVLSGDTVDTLGQRVRAIEGDLFVDALRTLSGDSRS